MKKRIVLIIVICAVLLGALHIFLFSGNYKYVGNFHVEDYQRYFAIVESDRTVGKIHNAKDAAQAAEALFDQELSIEKATYSTLGVMFDPDNDAWLVFGCGESIYAFDRTPFAIMKSDGDVLAVFIN